MLERGTSIIEVLEFRAGRSLEQEMSRSQQRCLIRQCIVPVSGFAEDVAFHTH